MTETPTKSDEKNSMPNRSELLSRIKERREKLYAAGDKLKERFVGLDDIIDQIIGNIEAWHVMPEFMSRPTIINLWGMTGVGKTDLVRTLVRELGLNNVFLEIQMKTGGGSASTSGRGSFSSIQSEIQSSNLEPDQPGVLLLDEIQRFRTIDDEGKEIRDTQFQDLWMLLSDGRFSGGTDREGMIRLLFEDMLWGGRYDSEDIDETDKEAVEKREKERDRKARRKYQRGYYSAIALKRTFRMSESIEEIMTWNDDKKEQYILSRIDDPSVYEGANYSRLLIFVSGNLDEAYRMSGDTSDADRDADVLHAFSLRINVISIKKALNKRFKPEQISRFGNTHVIYPSLSKSSYEGIINKKLAVISENTKAKHNIAVTFKPSVNTFIYRNGVFPAQGTRPVFSTISSYVENALPALLVNAVERDADSFSVAWADDYLTAAYSNGTTHSVVCKGMLDEIRKTDDIDRRSITAVHEAGHAVAYAVLRKLAPTQIEANITSDLSNGFISTHSLDNYSMDTIRAMVGVYMAGMIAEEIVFGEGQRGSGAAGDIRQATSVVANGVRVWGMFGKSSRIADVNWSAADASNNNNTAEVNDLIDEEVARGRVLANEVLTKHTALFREITDVLLSKGRLKPKQFARICATHGLEVEVIDPKKVVITGHSERCQSFLNQDNQKDRQQQVA